MKHLQLKRGLILLALGLLACQSQLPTGNPVSTGTGAAKAPVAKAAKGAGSIAAAFDFGQKINLRDFAAIKKSPATFKTKQTGGGSFSLADIARADVTIISPEVAEPTKVSLTRDEIAAGWTSRFDGIPVGAVAVTLEVFNDGGTKLFSDRRDVDVAANSLTPVDFTIVTDCSTCQDQGTGSIQVSVRAVTACFGRVKLAPVLLPVNQAMNASLTQLSGTIDQYTVDWGDGSSPETVASLPASHAYSVAGRYPVSITLQGGSCQNPYTTKGYISVE